jgi:hypothetical protein
MGPAETVHVLQERHLLAIGDVAERYEFVEPLLDRPAVLAFDRREVRRPVPRSVSHPTTVLGR